MGGVGGGRRGAGLICVTSIERLRCKCGQISDKKEQVHVFHLTWVVNESPKAYFQPSPRQVSLPPQHPV